jgi:transcriptional regulator with XRE-family HTH domain
MMNFKQAFGQHLKIVRKSKGITQERLSELIGIHPRQVSKIETGDHFPTSSTLENLCVELQILPKDLFSFEFDDVFSLNTGTGTVYNYKATIRNNVVYLHDSVRSAKIARTVVYNDIDEEMFIMAQNIKRSVIVQYNYDDGVSKTVEYFPDRSYKIVDASKDAEIQALMNKIRELAQDDLYLDFMKLMVSALRNDEDLDKLEMYIAGIKLASKNR